MIGTGMPAQAQEALFNSLGLDAALAQPNAASTPSNPQSFLAPPQSHWGPVAFTLAAYASVQANDNINTAQINPESDTILNAGLDFSLVWPATPQSELSLNSSLGYSKYLKYSDNDRVDIAPGSALSWRISFPDGSLTFFDQFSDTQSVISQASVSGVSSLPRIDNTTGARAEWDPGRWLWALSYSHDLVFSDAAADQYLNRSSEDFLLRGGRRLAEDTQLGLEASVSFTKYDQSIQSDNTSYSLGPYLEWQVTHFINASFRGGYTIYAFDANGAGQPAQNQGSYYVSMELKHQLTDNISQSFSVVRDISLGLSQGNNYTEQLTASYSVNWAATAHLGLNLSLSYEDGNQPLTELKEQYYLGFPVGQIPVSVNENFSRIGFSPGLSYQFTQKLSGSLNYSYWDRSSNLSGSYRDNSLTLQLQYSF